MTDDAPAQHEWNVDVLESTLKRSNTRLTIATVVAIPAAIIGVTGLVRGGSWAVWGLAGLLVGAVALSFVLRLKTKRDYCAAQLDKIKRGEGPGASGTT